MAVTIIQSPSANANSGASAALAPTLTLKSNVAVGDCLVVFVAQATNAVPGTPTDNLGNTYLPLAYHAGNDGALLGGAWYITKVTAGGHCTITFNNAAASAYGVYEIGNFAVSSKTGYPIGSGQINQIDPATSFYTGATAQTVGDLLLCVCLTSAQTTFTIDPSTPGWTQDVSSSSAALSAVALHAQPASAGNLPILIDSSAPCTAIVASLAIGTA